MYNPTEEEPNLTIRELAQKRYLEKIENSTRDYLMGIDYSEGDCIDELQFGIKALINCTGRVGQLLPRAMRELFVYSNVNGILKTVNERVGDMGVIMQKRLTELDDPDEIAELLHALKEINTEARDKDIAPREANF